MSTTTGKSLEELKAMRKSLMDQGKELSTSKELGKIENAIKVLQPKNYSSSQVDSAKLALRSSTQSASAGGLTATGSGGSSSSTGGMSAGGQPTIDLNKVYDTAMGSKEIKDLEALLNEKKTARTTAETNINDNPWFSEATRTGKLAKLQQQSQSELSDLESQLAQKKADAQTKVNIALQQYNIDDKNYQNNLQRLNMLISTGALTNASGADIASIALATGMTTDMVKGIQANMKTANVKPTVITNTDDNGNVTVSVIDSNTGKTINQNSLGKIGKADNTGSSGISAQEKAFDSAISDGIAQLKGGEMWGTVWNRIHARFPDVPAILIDSGLGTQWREGGAYEQYKAKTSSGL